MTPERQKKIDNFNEVSLWVFVIALLLWVAFLLLPKIWDIDDSYSIFKIIRNIFITISGLAFCSAMVSGFWATDEDKKRMKAILLELKAEEAAKPKPTIYDSEEIKIPLKGLTPQQISAVHELLQHIPEQNGHLKTSELVQMLRALKGQGDLDDSNMQQVIAWVEHVTQKKVDERNFKYDYESKYSDKGVVKWGDRIRARFDRIEIS